MTALNTVGEELIEGIQKLEQIHQQVNQRRKELESLQSGKRKTQPPTNTVSLRASGSIRKTFAGNSGNPGTAGLKQASKTTDFQLYCKLNQNLFLARSGPWVCSCKFIYCENITSAFHTLYELGGFVEELEHKNVLQVLYLSQNQSNLTMFIPYPSLSLSDYLIKFKAAYGGVVFMADDIAKFLLPICYGIQYLHEKEIVIRSLHSSTIYIYLKNEHLEIERILISPFFVAKKDKIWKVWKSNDDFYNPTYSLAPEIKDPSANQSHYEYYSDVWALGIIIFELLTLLQPYSVECNSTDEVITLSAQQRPTLPDRECFADSKTNSYQNIIDLFKYCTNINPLERPTIQDIIKALQTNTNIKEIYKPSYQYILSVQQWIEDKPVEFSPFEAVEETSLIKHTQNFKIEAPTVLSLKHFTDGEDPLYGELVIQNIENPCYYKNHLLNEPHENYQAISEIDNVTVIFISISLHGILIDDFYHYRALFRTLEADYRFVIKAETEQPKDRIKALKSHSQLLNFKLFQIKDAAIIQSLIAFDDDQKESKQYKFGVIYRQAGQTLEDDLLANDQPSNAFETFLNILGTRVQLLNFKNFRGGLDTTNNTTGTESVYVTLNEFEVMFHVSTLLPYDNVNVQQLHRKRHIGNDVVVILFQDHDCDQFTPAGINSQFNHVFIVIQPCNPKSHPEFAATPHYRFV